MLDFFVILSKGGIVLWCMEATMHAFREPVNALLHSIVLNSSRLNAPFIHESNIIKFHMDNEFELVYVVGYQKMLQLGYVDKLLTAIQLEFRDRYKNDLLSKNYGHVFDFNQVFNAVLLDIERSHREEEKTAKPMRQFKDTEKANKTVASMIVKKPAKAELKTKPETVNNKQIEPKVVTKEKENGHSEKPVEPVDEPAVNTEALQKLANKFSGKKTSKEEKRSSKEGKKPKESRRWDGAATGEEAAALDYSSQGATNGAEPTLSDGDVKMLQSLRGKMSGDLNDVEVSSDEEEDNEEQEEEDQKQPNKTTNGSRGGMFSGFFKTLGLSSSGPLTAEQLKPSLEYFRDHLIAKNVACEIATKLCDSVAQSLVGLQLGTFERPQTRVKAAVSDACVRLLSSCRRIDVLRDILDAKEKKRPYTMVFCGVNGVGKSTNLAKIAFWLTEKNLRVLIAACDTFRSGAVEQLRTHVQRLNYIHPSERLDKLPMVELYEKGYGRDPASIAMSAINHAKEQMCDVVMVDTAGRMQDNEPLMRALSKLINLNNPDLVLFVGEALVGNEAVDQLTKFNQSLADHSQSERPRGIDGIVLTKFDTIDDKVGAAISMAYISGQPIVFVGTGQTYTDLRQLSVNSVVKALMK